jgi:putative spermidine/putrescine transport system substrate-binding protein
MRRMSVAAMVMVCASSAVLTACGGSDGAASSGSGGKELTFVSYGAGTYQDAQEAAWLKPFEQSQGAKVTIAGPSDNAKLTTMVKANNVSWDVVDTDAFFPRENCGTLVEKIDVGSLAGAFPKGTLSSCGVPDALFGLLFMYNAKTYGDKPPTGLADFFDPKAFPGKRVIFSADPTIGNLEAALMGDGVAPDALYPLDVDRALKAFDRIKSDLILSPTYGAQQQAMVGNQADMALVVSARAYSVLKAGGTNWKPVWDHVPVTWDVLVIPKGAPHTDLAQQFIRYASQPEQSAGFAERSGAGAANVNAKPEITDPLQREVNAFSPEHQAIQVPVDAQWWTKNRAKTVEAWTRWTSG